MKNKSLQTTVSGVCAALAAVTLAVIHAFDGNPDTAVNYTKAFESLAILAGGLSVLYGMWKARDHDVSSIQAGIELPKPSNSADDTPKARPGFFRASGILIFALLSVACQSTQPLIASHKDMTTTGKADHLDRIRYDSRLKDEQRKTALETWTDFYTQKAKTRKAYEDE